MTNSTAAAWRRERSSIHVDPPPAANTSACELALNLARAGLKVFPLDARKKPLHKGGHKIATTDDAAIRKAFEPHRATMVGIACGENGLLVLDADTPKPEKGRHHDGRKGIEELTRSWGINLSTVPQVETPSGGKHYIYSQPDGERLGNGTGGLPPNIDVRGSGGYIVAPGSVSPAGRYTPVPGTPDLLSLYEAGLIPPALPPEIAAIIRQGAVRGSALLVQPASPLVHPSLPLEILIEILELLENGEWCDYERWRDLAFAIASLAKGDAAVEAAYSAWSTVSEKDATPEIFRKGRAGEILMSPAGAGRLIAQRLREHHLAGEGDRAEELAQMLLQGTGSTELFDDLDPSDIFGGGPGTYLPDIPGGVYTQRETIGEFSRRYALVNHNGQPLIAYRKSSGAIGFMRIKDFEELHANVWVDVTPPRAPGGDEAPKQKAVQAAHWWRLHIKRPPVKHPVFKPHHAAGACELNLWTGFGVERVAGDDKIDLLKNHIFEVVCREDEVKYRYLMLWLARMVQRPDEAPGVAIVLISPREGTGKSTVSATMHRLLGKHAVTITDPNELLGAYNEHLEYACFAMVEEALFAGDPRIAEKTRSRLTSEKLLINPKFRPAYEIPNRLHVILTTNHAHAVDAGTGARRWFVCEVDDSRAGDKNYFDALYRDLEAGGYGQFLNFLLELDLKDFHPRSLPRTRELGEQQKLSAGGIEAWLLEALTDGGIAIYTNGRRELGRLQFGQEYATSALLDAYTGFAFVRKKRPLSAHALGRALRDILGADAYNKNIIIDGERRRGFRLPNAAGLAAALEAHMGLTAGAIEHDG